MIKDLKGASIEMIQRHYTYSDIPKCSCGRQMIQTGMSGMWGDEWVDLHYECPSLYRDYVGYISHEFTIVRIYKLKYV